jgi:hypothetical protein
MQSQVDCSPCVVVSAALVCQVMLYASERVVSRYQYLTGSNPGKRWYQRLPYIINLLGPVRYRYSFEKLSHERRTHQTSRWIDFIDTVGHASALAKVC